MWLHGEAVAAGTVMAADMSHRLGWIERDVLDRTVRLLQRAKLPIAAPAVRPRLLWPMNRYVTRNSGTRRAVAAECASSSTASCRHKP